LSIIGNKMKIKWNGIEWGNSYLKPEYRKLGWEPYYFKWDRVTKEDRENWKEYPDTNNIGFFKFWYDCPHAQLNLYFLCFYWSSPWTSYDKDKWG